MSLAPTIIASGSGATVKGVTLDFVKSLKIPLPPLEVQKKIVADIENKQKAIDHAREIIQVLERERELILTQALAPPEKTGQS